MIPNLEYIKTLLNALMCRFRRVKSDVDAVKSDVDAVKSDVDAVKSDVDAVKSDVDSVKSKQPNWNEADTTSHSYIQNKPCYDYVEPSCVIYSANPVPSGNYGTVNLGDIGDMILVEGKEYTLTIDGVSNTYTCTLEDDGKLYVNNIYQLPSGGTLAAMYAGYWNNGTSSITLEGPVRRYKKLAPSLYNAVTSVNGATGDVEITPEGIGAAKVIAMVIGKVVRNTIYGITIGGTLCTRLYLGYDTAGLESVASNVLQFIVPSTLKNVNTPVDMTDAANKAYVDNAVLSARDSIILHSSNEGSTKQFKITVDDDGIISVTEVAATVLTDDSQ